MKGSDPPLGELVENRFQTQSGSFEAPFQVLITLPAQCKILSGDRNNRAGMLQTVDALAGPLVAHRLRPWNAGAGGSWDGGGATLGSLPLLSLRTPGKGDTGGSSLALCK